MRRIYMIIGVVLIALIAGLTYLADTSGTSSPGMSPVPGFRHGPTQDQLRNFKL